MNNKEAIEAVRQILDSVRDSRGNIPRIVRNGVREMVDSGFKERMERARELAKGIVQKWREE